MIGILAAVARNFAIGVDGALPWHYPADLQRFKRLTLGHTVIMGRRTWESLPKKPLPGRRNVVLTRQPIAGVDCFSSLATALSACRGDVWCIGGAQVFAEAMLHAACIDLTHVPTEVQGRGVVFFPNIDVALWEAGSLEALPEDPRLGHQVFRRRE